MKYLLALAIVLGAETAYASDEVQAIEAQLLKHSAKGAVPADQLALAIVELSRVYNVDAKTVASIVLQESRGRASAYNARTRDTGLMQINYKTARALGIPQGCLKQWQCNLAHGVRILSHFSRTCRYNVGTRELIGDILVKCLVYEQKLAMLE